MDYFTNKRALFLAPKYTAKLQYFCTSLCQWDSRSESGLLTQNTRFLWDLAGREGRKNWLWMSRRVKMQFSPSQHVHGVFLWVVVRKWACERHKWSQQVGFAAGFVSDAQLSLDSRSALTAISLWCVLSGLVLTMLWGCQSLILYANVLCCCVCYPAQERGTARASCLHWIFECVPGQ